MAVVNHVKNAEEVVLHIEFQTISRNVFCPSIIDHSEKVVIKFPKFGGHGILNSRADSPTPKP